MITLPVHTLDKMYFKHTQIMKRAGNLVSYLNDKQYSREEKGLFGRYYQVTFGFWEAFYEKGQTEKEIVESAFRVKALSTEDKDLILFYLDMEESYLFFEALYDKINEKDFTVTMSEKEWAVLDYISNFEE